MLKLVSLLLFVAISAQADFTCPTALITQGGSNTGNLPTGATSPLAVPTGTNCTIRFTIPKGYALQFDISGSSTSSLDVVTVLDNTGGLRTIINNSVVLPNQAIGWMGAGSAAIQVIGATGKSTFFTKYTYKSLAGFKQTKKNTGEYVALKEVKGDVYYTFTSSKNDNVRATIGLLAGSSDTTTQQFFVYNGADLTTADMIGTLDEVSKQGVASGGNSLSIVNLYGVDSTSYVLANDASTVRGSRYSVVMTRSGRAVNASLTDLNVGSMYTFICTDCNRFFLTQFAFDRSRTYSNVAYTTFQGQTPTHRMEKLINYTYMDFTSRQIPQLLPTNAFTMTLYMSGIRILIAATNDYSEWKTPFDGRKGYIFSPNLWNPTGPFAFSEEFRNDSQLYNFQLNMDRMTFGSNSDTLKLKIGPSSGNPSVDNTYPQDKSSTGKVSSNGNFMSLVYTGSQSADIRLSFEMKVASGSASIGILASLALILHRLL